MPARSLDLAQTFRHFATKRAGSYAPLYARLAEAIAEDPFLLQVAARARPGQSCPDLLLGVVHDLLHDHPTHPAARFYPSLSADPDRVSDPVPDVLAFCHDHLDLLAERVATRLVQTNEVRRCTFLLPALQVAGGLAGDRSLALIEVGASAALNLHFDRFGYRYTRSDGWEAFTAPKRAAPVLCCEVRSVPLPPVHGPFPHVIWRAGIDLNPLDPTIPSDRRWLRALVWPDHAVRAARLEAALDVAAQHPITVHRGDVTDHLPAVVDRVPEDLTLVVFHSAVIAHMTNEDRQRFTTAVLRCSRHRPIVWIQAEPRADGDPRRLRLTFCADGAIRDEYSLGTYQPHGQWLEWACRPGLIR